MNQKKASGRLERRSEAVAGYLFAAPAIIGFLVLTLYPMLASLFYSFNNISLKGGMKWVGLGNYTFMFTDSSSEFWKSLQVTLLYALGNVILIVLYCLGIALLLNRNFRGKNFLRAIFFLPSVIPMITVAILWKIILQNQAQGGLLNQLLMALGIHTQEWLTDPNRIFFTLFMMSLWTCGGTIVVFIATLQDVPSDLLEAMDVDGGNAWHKFSRVTMPFIRPVVFFQLIMIMITSIQIFTQSVVLSSNGAPDRMTYFINVMIFDHAFKAAGTRGLAAAEAWIIFLVIFVLTAVLFLLDGSLLEEGFFVKKGKRRKAK